MELCRIADAMEVPRHVVSNKCIRVSPSKLLPGPLHACSLIIITAAIGLTHSRSRRKKVLCLEWSAWKDGQGIPYTLVRTRGTVHKIVAICLLIQGWGTRAG